MPTRTAKTPAKKAPARKAPAKTTTAAKKAPSKTARPKLKGQIMGTMKAVKAASKKGGGGGGTRAPRIVSCRDVDCGSRGSSAQLVEQRTFDPSAKG